MEIFDSFLKQTTQAENLGCHNKTILLAVSQQIGATGVPIIAYCINKVNLFEVCYV